MVQFLSAAQVARTGCATVVMPDGPASGTLDEPQVQAMFDRIAGVYDLMNSVMTAGLHHRWRARAADLASVAPGDDVARRR